MKQLFNTDVFKLQLSQYPLFDEDIPRGVEVENPARDYHPALEITCSSVATKAWLIPFVLKKQSEYLVPLWLPLVLENGWFKVDPHNVTPWIPGCLSLHSQSCSPWLGAFDQIAHLSNALAKDWQEAVPTWPEFYHRCIMMLEECAKTPWRHYFQRHGWSTLPARLILGRDDVEALSPHEGLYQRPSSINRAKQSQLSVLGGAENALSLNDFLHLNRCISHSQTGCYALDTKPEQSVPFVANLIAAKVVECKLTSQSVSIDLYAPKGLNPKKFEKYLAAAAKEVEDFDAIHEKLQIGLEYLSLLHPIKADKSTNALESLKHKLYRYQSKDEALERALHHLQKALSDCDNSIPRTWTEKLDFVHQKRERQRDIFLQETCKSYQIREKKLQYQSIGKTISDLKVKRHKVHTKIMQIAQERCSKESLLQKFMHWCKKHLVDCTNEDLEVLLHSIWKVFGFKLFQSALKTTRYEFISRDPYHQRYSLQITPANTVERIGASKQLILFGAHLISEADYLELSQDYQHVLMFGELLTPYYGPDCSQKSESAVHSLLYDEELPLQKLISEVPHLEYDNGQLLPLKQLHRQLFMPPKDRIPLSEGELVEFVIHTGKSNIKDMHFCNIHEVQVITSLASVQKCLSSPDLSLAIVTPFYEQKKLLATSLPDILVFTLAELPDVMFDTLVFSTVYSHEDPRPYCFDEGPGYFSKVISHTRKRLIIVGDKQCFNPHLNTTSGIIARSLIEVDDPLLV